MAPDVVQTGSSFVGESNNAHYAAIFSSITILKAPFFNALPNLGVRQDISRCSNDDMKTLKPRFVVR